MITFEHEAKLRSGSPTLDRSVCGGTDKGTVAVVGLGYVGLPTALGLHVAGRPVLGVDASAQRLAQIREGSPDLIDADILRLACARADEQSFQLSEDPTEIAKADCVLICVPTPIDDRQTPNLEPLRSACASVVLNARQGQTLVLTSTSYVGTTRDLLIDPLERRGFTVGEDVHVCFAPERVDPANTTFALSSLPKVLGGATPACTAAAASYLECISPQLHPVSSPEAAEMTKLLENTFRAVNVALANEVADITHTLGLDAVEVIDAAATKPYGFMPFYPGPGVGGHCIPCDPHYLLWQLRDERMYPPLILAAMQDIATRPARVVARAAEVLEEAGSPIKGANVLVVGVAYKPNVADVRESPALEVISGLRQRGAAVSIYDPLVRRVEAGGEVFGSCDLMPDLATYDLVVVTCLHDVMEVEAFDDARLVLDATYRLGQDGNCFVP